MRNERGISLSPHLKISVFTHKAFGRRTSQENAVTVFLFMSDSLSRERRIMTTRMT
jgi:hypothetical protein